MKNRELNIDTRRNRYLKHIIASLHIRMDDFMESITQEKNCYEKTIYIWSMKLFEKGVGKEQAIKIIQRARFLVIMVRGEQLYSPMHTQTNKKTIESFSPMKTKNNTKIKYINTIIDYIIGIKKWYGNQKN